VELWELIGQQDRKPHKNNSVKKIPGKFFSIQKNPKNILLRTRKIPKKFPEKSGYAFTSETGLPQTTKKTH